MFTRAFRRLLFEQYSADDSTVTATKAPPATPSNAKTSSANANPAPDARELLRLPYVAHLRPSTLLGYLLSCGPAQLPAPFEATQSGAGSDSLSVYVDMLTDVFRTQRLGAMKQKSSSKGVKPLYGHYTLIQLKGGAILPTRLRAGRWCSRL